MVYVGTIWMAVLLSLIGMTSNYYLLLVLAALAGLGTAAFHPQAAAKVSAVSGARKGFFQSIFIAGGNVGWALTPLMVIPLIKAYGMEITPVFAVPGMLVAILLWFTAPRISAVKKTGSGPLMPVSLTSWFELVKVVLIVACRSLTYFGLIAFLPLYLQTQNISIVASSHFLFIMLFAGAIGGVFGGHLSDKLGRKTVIGASLILSTPCFYLFLQNSGFAMYIFLTLAGAAPGLFFGNRRTGSGNHQQKCRHGFRTHLRVRNRHGWAGGWNHRRHYRAYGHFLWNKSAGMASPDRRIAGVHPKEKIDDSRPGAKQYGGDQQSTGKPGIALFFLIRLRVEAAYTSARCRPHRSCGSANECCKRVKRSRA